MQRLPDALLHCLRRHIGLNPASINTHALINGVQQRMQALSIDDIEAYSARVQQDSEELQQLIEATVVPETSFFRHPAAFIALRKLAQRRKRKDIPWRILCIPCSTGEEPYSVAMCLLQAGLRDDEFLVDAVDVSRLALARAERAVYSEYSFRGEMVRQYMHFFSPVKQGWQVKEEVRRCIHFHHCNILDEENLVRLGRYPVIFCRNLLIYLHAEARRKAARVISRMLEPDGTLFVGNAENAQVWHGHFRSRRIPLAFAMCHPQHGPDDSQQICAADIHPRPTIAPPAQADASTLAETKQPQQPNASLGEEECSDEHIRRAADHGDLEQVRRLCEQRLRIDPQCANAYFYRALAYEAEGRHDEAIQALRQTIYLCPHHVHALQQLALLLDLQKETQAAERVRQRLRRLQREEHGS